MREFAKLYITKKAEHNAKLGHPWVFGEEVIRVEGEYSNGDLVDVMNDKAKYIGTGFVNDNSKIRVRIISRNTNDKYDRDFFERRIRYALEYRITVMGEENFKCCRLLFGEADQFPGLTVDRFNDILVVQVLCLGIDQRKTMIFELLLKILGEMGQTIHGIYERNDVAIRKLEGLEEYKSPFVMDSLGACPVTTTIEENGLLFNVDVVNGQKTGFFLDQKFNRLAIRKISKGRRVLDCFTHTGAFAINAAAGGATAVTAVDISLEAINETKKNIILNGFTDKIATLQANVFDLLTDMAEKKEKKYDFIILDPPAFTKSSHTVKNALSGYREINYKAMKLLPRGGYLATCSCSHFMPEGLFIHMLKEAAFDANVSLRQVEARQQSQDHPILYNVPETNYLKFYIFQVV